MRRLFLIFYTYRFFFTFLFLQIICWWLILSKNRFVNASFFNSSNQIVAGVYNIKTGLQQYFSLKKVNIELARENAFLRDLISNIESPAVGLYNSPESMNVQQFSYIPAKVINKSIHRINNFLTLNRGSSSGIKSGMGVIGSGGIVGQVKAVSKRYTTVQTLLHSEMYVSSVHKRSSALCTTHWNGIDPNTAQLLYIPRHIEVLEGDTIMTSGYNAVFPQDVIIGVVKSVNVKENDTFLDINIDLGVDFYSLTYVYIIENKLRMEKDSIEISVIE